MNIPELTGAVILSDSAKKKLVSEIRDQIISDIKQNGLTDSDEIIAREEEQGMLGVRNQRALKKLKLIRGIISF